MLNVTKEQLTLILKEFSIYSDIKSVTELQRDDFNEYGTKTDKVRLIIKVELSGEDAVVVRFRNELNMTVEMIEAQCRFAQTLYCNGIETPKQYKTGECFTKRYDIGDYNVIVTIEQFVENEIQIVDEDIAIKQGELLAMAHNISENNDCHIGARVLFDPTTKNDLFGFEEFENYSDYMIGSDTDLYYVIIDKYNEHMKVLKPFCNEKRYAVQGDISECNTYIAKNGDVGIFDFNWCGDNILYFDAIMQSVFVAWLMDYPESYADCHESLILSAFLKGYNSKRPFSEEQKKAFTHLYAVINAFELGFIKYDQNSLYSAIEKDDKRAVTKALEEIYKRLCTMRAMPIG